MASSDRQDPHGSPVLNAQSPRPAGEGTARLGEGSTLPLALTEVGDRTVPEGAQTPGPCPHCGGYGPRIVLCHNPDCLHSESVHDLKRNGSRGACSVSTGRKATPCSCTAFVPNTETT